MVKKKKEERTVGDVVLAKWLDASLDNTAMIQEGSPLPELELLSTVGFFVGEDNEKIGVAQDLVGEGEYRSIMVIPKVLLQSIVVLIAAGDIK